MLGCITKKGSEKPSAESSEATDSKNDDQGELESCSDSGVYQAFIVEFIAEEGKIHMLETDKSKQVRIQFLYREKAEKNVEKFLLLVHQECKYIKHKVNN